MDWRTRKRLDDQADQEAAAADQAGHLLGLTTQPAEPVGPDLVGWMQTVPGTVKGTGHRCRRCQPTRPHRGHWVHVLRNQLAARAGCTKCGRILELV
jgi:hypothetical protein